jgi:REP element-mobilizing transposase RayT
MVETPKLGVSTTPTITNIRKIKMAELYKNRYRVESARLKNWDYSAPGGYFITICTKNRISYFGEITNGEMILSQIGQFVDKYWREIPTHFPRVQLDEFVVMPNHVHGIINIETVVETPKLGVSTVVHTDWKSASLGLIINQYKRICTIQIKKQGYDFAWQSLFMTISSAMMMS